MSERIFFLSSHMCEGESGGGHGVIYRLYQANQVYKILPNNTVYVFMNCVAEDSRGEDQFLIQREATLKSPLRVALTKYIPNFIRISNQKRRYDRIGAYLEELNKQYTFCESDVFICHDFRIAYVFLNRFPGLKCAYVHHMQGSVYFEWHSETGLNSKPMKKLYDAIFCDICKKADMICFPSQGTEESIINSEPEMQNVVENTKRRYLYNGVSCPVIEDIKPWVDEISKLEGYKFVTIANLNAAKAVERIPEYLYHLRQNGVRFTWVLVGNGVQAAAVAEKIDEYQLKDNIIWKKERVEHLELMQLLSISDFYILFHRFSIFDLSTLEAMHYGNIPILTPVGGNKEMIIDDNGLLVSDFSDVGSFLEMLQSGNMKTMREKNMYIQKSMFDDRAFLQRYADLCDEIVNRTKISK